jgi:hypothetical protein
MLFTKIILTNALLTPQPTVDQLPNPKVLCVASLNPCRGGEWYMGDVSLTEPQGNQATSLSM